VDDFEGDGFARRVKVADAAAGVNAIIGFSRDFKLTQGIFF
jgi:hypothetical protein